MMAAATRVRMRGGSGLGDALYLRPIAEDLVRRGHAVTVCSNYGDVFRGSACDVEPFRRERVDLIAHYVGGKDNPCTTIWQDICTHARVPARLAFGWQLGDKALVRRVQEKAAGRPLVLVHTGREPMGRRDGFGIELLPRAEAFAAVLGALGDCFTVRVGRGNELYPAATSLDLWNATTVAQLLDLAWVCDGIVSMCGFPIPMAESFDKPALFVWAARGLASANPFIRTVTPAKMLSKPTSRFVIDDWPEDALRDAARDFRGVLP